MNSQERIAAARKNVPETVWTKWGAAALRGYQPIPHDLFRFQAQLELSNSELVTLLNVLDFWWDAKNTPFPGTGALAKRMNTDPRTVQRHLKSLQSKGYAVRERGNDEKRRFNLSGLTFRLSKLVLKEMGLPDDLGADKVFQQVA
jgi:hypothetical protein